MGNNLFDVLSSNTRVNILKKLSKEEMHITGLAKEMGISVPVTARHVKVLEEAGLVQRKKFGRTHVLRSTLENMESILNEFADSCEVNLPAGSSIFDALKKVSGVEIKEVRDKEFVVSIDGEQGFYIYEVNGMPPDTTVKEFTVEKDSIIEWKKLVPVTRKKIFVKIEK